MSPICPATLAWFAAGQSERLSLITHVEPGTQGITYAKGTGLPSRTTRTGTGYRYYIAQDIVCPLSVFLVDRFRP